MDWLTILFWILAIVGVLRALNLVGGKTIPLKRNAAVLLAVIGIGGLAWSYGYLAGLQLPTVPSPSAPTPSGGFLFEVTGSETDANLTYNATDKVFTVNVVENTTSGGCSPDNVTFTLTIRRVDTLGDNNAVAAILSSVPGWLNERDTTDSKTYYPVTKTGLDFNVEFTPAGGSMSREDAFASISAAGSKDVTVVVRLSDDIDTLNLYNSKDVIINVAGTQFRLRVLLNSQVA